MSRPSGGSGNGAPPVRIGRAGGFAFALGILAGAGIFGLSLLPGAGPASPRLSFAPSPAWAAGGEMTAPPTAGLLGEVKATRRSVRLTVEGVTRRAIVWAPSAATRRATPVLFVFHGHGGSAEQAERAYALHRRWRQAIVVYGQGLPTPSLYDPQGTKAGWQHLPGDDGDRDLLYVDALLDLLAREYRVDEDRVHAFGHSNGSRFEYVLWVERGAVFASFITSSAQGGTLPLEASAPRSIFAVVGERDPLVAASGQLRCLDLVRQVLATDPDQATVDGFLRIEPGRNGTALATWIHPGGHQLPLEALTPALAFLREHPRPAP